MSMVLIGHAKMPNCADPELAERLELRELDVEGGNQRAILPRREREGFCLREPSLDVAERGLAAIHDDRTIGWRQGAASGLDRTRVRLLVSREFGPELGLTARGGSERPVDRGGAFLERQAAVE